MEEHVALAKANLVRAKAQYKAAQKLYDSALELQKASRSYETQDETTVRVQSRRTSLSDGVAVDLTSDVNGAKDVEQLSPTFCKDCRTSSLVTCFIENTWPGSKRTTLCDLSEASSKKHNCALCQFLVDASRLIQTSSPSATSTSTRDSITDGQVRIVQGSSKDSWPKVAGCALDVPVKPFAWLELGSHPKIGFAEAKYVCVALSPSEDIQQNQMPREISGPRIRTMYEQSTGLIDVDLVKSWMNICETFHGPKCENIHHIENGVSPSIPVYLIDLKTRKIAVAQPQTRYVAVSYVCGDNVFNVNSNTAVVPCDDDERLIPQGVDGGLQLPKTLPQTLEDALTLTEAIGERFVWIDKFCIDQNNEAEVEEQISNMDSIY